VNFFLLITEFVSVERFITDVLAEADHGEHQSLVSTGELLSSLSLSLTHTYILFGLLACPLHASVQISYFTIFFIVMFVLYVRVRRYTLTVDDRRAMGGDEASHTYIN
jgi:hypothetical protein